MLTANQVKERLKLKDTPDIAIQTHIEEKLSL